MDIITPTELYSSDNDVNSCIFLNNDVWILLRNVWLSIVVVDNTDGDDDNALTTKEKIDRTGS